MITQIIKKIAMMGIVMILVLIFGLNGVGLAEEVTGEISGMTNESISIVYKRDEAKGEEFEILLPLDAEIKLERVGDLKSLNIGDTVTVSYDKVKETSEEGEEVTKVKTKKIKFVRPVQIKPEPETPESETELLTSQ